MKTLKLLTLGMIGILMATMVSCDEDPITPTNPSVFNFETGSSKTASFFGTIVDENNDPLSGVDVLIGSSTATTNTDGIFFIEDASVFEKHAYIKATKAGYFLGSRSLVPTDGTNTVKIMMIPMTNIGSFNAAAGGVVSGGGLSIDFQSGIVDASGTAFTGNVNVAAHYIDPEGDDLALEMPGNLIGADADGGKYLETYGMVAVELTDDSGNELQLAEGSPAEITFPLSASLVGSAPATIPLWSFDEANGWWIYEGEATLVGNTYIGEVSHFSFWNCDIPTTYTTIEGQIVDAMGNGMSGIQLKVVSTNWGTGSAITDATGFYGGIVPAGEPLTLEVYYDCGAGSPLLVHTESLGSISAPTAIPAITVSSTSIVYISGTVVDCALQPVSNGFVTVGGTNVPLSGGVFSAGACAGSSVTVQAYDFDNAMESGATTYNLTSANVSIGQIQACNGISEYIIWDTNGEGYISTSGFQAYSQGPANGGFSGSTPNFFSFEGTISGPGTYVVDSTFMNYLSYESDSVTNVGQVVGGSLDMNITQWGTNSGDLIEGNFNGILETSGFAGTTIDTINGSMHFLVP